MDDQLQRLGRRAAAGDVDAETELFAALRRAGREPTFEELVTSRRWHKVVGVVRKWFVRPLEPRDGAKPAAIAAAERRLGVRLPDVLREWYTLLGRRFEEPRAGLLTANRPWSEGERLAIAGHPADGCLVFASSGDRVAVQRRFSRDESTRWRSVGDLTPDFFAGLLLHELVSHYTVNAGRPEAAHGGHVKAVTNESRDLGEPSRLRAAVARRYASLDLPFTIAPNGSVAGRFSYELRGDADTVVAVWGDGVWTNMMAWTRTEEAWARLRDVPRGWVDLWQRGPRGGWREVPFEELS